MKKKEKRTVSRGYRAEQKPADFPHVEAGLKYARDVVSGKMPAGPYVRLACKRQLDDLAKQKRAEWPYRFDKAAGERICAFMSMMVHVKGKWARQKIKLEPWQCFIWSTVFGWLKKQTGKRRFKEVYAEIPRKNSKSTQAAAVGDYMLTADGEEGAECYSGATTEDQALEVFRPAWEMVNKNPEFKNYYGLDLGGTYKNPKSVYCVPSSGRFAPLIGKPGEGSSPSCAIVDEYHEHKTSVQYDAMKTGQGAREQPLLLVITTAGTNLSGPCKAQHDYVIQVMDGVLENEELFGIIYGLDKDDDWTDFNNWIKANPNYNVSVFEDYLRQQHRDAMQIASRQNILRCKHLNQWLNADVAWMNILEWQACKAPIRLEDYEGFPCWIGLDLASKNDIAEMVILFRLDGERAPEYRVFCKHYLPEKAIEEPQNQHYRSWLMEGWITQAGQARTDYEFIKEDLRELKGRFQVETVAYDPFQATQLSTELAAEGFPMVETGATIKNFSDPMKELEALVLDRKIQHNGDPVMTWMMSNVVAHRDKKDNIFPNKERAENKIDGPVALIMALSRAMVKEQQGFSIPTFV